MIILVQNWTVNLRLEFVCFVCFSHASQFSNIQDIETTEVRTFSCVKTKDHLVKLGARGFDVTKSDYKLATVQYLTPLHWVLNQTELNLVKY